MEFGWTVCASGTVDATFAATAAHRRAAKWLRLIGPGPIGQHDLVICQG
jgi:hypothetical protein